MQLVRYEDEDVVYEFTAERIAGPVSTKFDPRGRQRARWMEASLYRKEDDTYVFVQESFSTVWHLPGGEDHVRKPVTISRQELPAKAVYCGVLPPRREHAQCPEADLGESRAPGFIPDEVVFEEVQLRVRGCPDRDSVIGEMVKAHRRNGVVSAAVSGPMRDLLDEAAENDPAFRTDTKPVVRL